MVSGLAVGVWGHPMASSTVALDCCPLHCALVASGVQAGPVAQLQAGRAVGAARFIP